MASLLERVSDVERNDTLTGRFVEGLTRVPGLLLWEALAPLVGERFMSSQPGITASCNFATSYLSTHPQCQLSLDEVAAINFFTRDSPLIKHMQYLLRAKSDDLSDQLAGYAIMPYLRLLVRAMAKLPTQRRKLFRAVADDAIRANYSPGTSVTWWSFSSTTVDSGAADNPMSFLGRSWGEATVFHIEAQYAIDISMFSEEPGLSERWLLPGTTLKVVSWECKREGIHEISLVERAPPLCCKWWNVDIKDSISAVPATPSIAPTVSTPSPCRFTAGNSYPMPPGSISSASSFRVVKVAPSVEDIKAGIFVLIKDEKGVREGFEGTGFSWDVMRPPCLNTVQQIVDPKKSNCTGYIITTNCLYGWGPRCFDAIVEIDTGLPHAKQLAVESTDIDPPPYPPPLYSPIDPPPSYLTIDPPPSYFPTPDQFTSASVVVQRTPPLTMNKLYAIPAGSIGKFKSFHVVQLAPKLEDIQKGQYVYIKDEQGVRRAFVDSGHSWDSYRPKCINTVQQITETAEGGLAGYIKTTNCIFGWNAQSFCAIVEVHEHEAFEEGHIYTFNGQSFRLLALFPTFPVLCTGTFVLLKGKEDVKSALQKSHAPWSRQMEKYLNTVQKVTGTSQGHFIRISACSVDWVDSCFLASVEPIP
ncbi:hypothetical protein Pelo_5756 [Pelomyxa schiedti]|nr:hypothetical protein Pelo_5756 [Pelomyxa schiedti]